VEHVAAKIPGELKAKLIAEADRRRWTLSLLLRVICEEWLAKKPVDGLIRVRE
jgi:hypothetical protein